jgi:hypothetical protein
MIISKVLDLSDALERIAIDNYSIDYKNKVVQLQPEGMRKLYSYLFQVDPEDMLVIYIHGWRFEACREKGR